MPEKGWRDEVGCHDVGTREWMGVVVGGLGVVDMRGAWEGWEWRILGGVWFGLRG